jgi:gluconokinase
MVILLMGVAGSGKTTVGLALAGALQWRFVDADDFHSPANIAKMQAGTPLQDADRAPWLASLHDAIAGWLHEGSNVILACSALKQTYREELLAGQGVKLVYLRGSQDLIAKRLSERHGHYMNPELLASQFATLEEPRDALVIDVGTTVARVVGNLREALGL